MVPLFPPHERQGGTDIILLAKLKETDLDFGGAAIRIVPWSIYYRVTIHQFLSIRWKRFL
jgi:hypothetical protein